MVMPSLPLREDLMRTILRTISLWSIPLVFAGLGAPAAEAPADFDPLWSDGRAEISLYGGETLRYGQWRPHRVRIVVVKEPFLRSSLVKADGRGDLEVLKLHLRRTFPTGTYDYHQALTLFAEPGGRILKETAVSTDGCGTTFSQARRALPGEPEGSLSVTARSYWEGEAEIDRRIEDAAEVGFFDGLLLSPRLETPRPGRRRLPLLPTRLESRATRLAPVPASVSVGKPESVLVPAGEYMAVPVRIELADEEHRLWFDVASPHVLVRRESPDTRWELLRTLRLDYWNHRDPGDEALVSP